MPTKHYETWFDAPREVQIAILDKIDALKVELDSEFNPDGYNIGVNCGLVAGQTIMHLHVHLIPRYEGDLDDPTGGVRGVIPSKMNYKRGADE